MTAIIELNDWIKANPGAQKPWMMLGKGPTFSQVAQTDLTQYNTISLNHAVREVSVDLAHVIDIDVIEDLGDVLLKNCKFLIMPRHPHVSARPCPHLSLSDWVKAIPVLGQLKEQGRLVTYDLALGKEEHEQHIPLIYFSSEAALGILGKLGAKTVRSLGVDGGRSYSEEFQDIEKKALLSNGQPTFDLQFRRLNAIAKKYGIDYKAMVEPMLVFVGAAPESVLAANVLAYTIHKFATRPVRVVPMHNLNLPVAKDPKNRARTGFSFTRFVIPELANYSARALYVDSDMQVFTDISELWDIEFGDQKVLCTSQPVFEKWKDNPGFHPGRQYSVMLLDTPRLPWKIQEIVKGLDDGKFTYEDLLFECCLVKPEEIEDRIPSEWNNLEHYEEGKTKLLHYTMVNTQPWTCAENPLGHIWEAALKEALETGWVTAAELEDNLEKGYLRQSLAHFRQYALVEDSVPKPKVKEAQGHSAGLQALVNDHNKLQDDMTVLDKENRHLNASKDNLQEQIVELKKQLLDKEVQIEASAKAAAKVEVDYKKRIESLEQDKHAVYRSTTWKVGRILTKPAHFLKRGG
jgi:hypothetical protein